MIMLTVLVLSLLVSSGLYLVSFLISFKVKNKNKLTPFESGFSCVGSIHSSFSIHFFIILVMFVLFDLEVVLLIGCVLSISKLGFLLIMLFVVGSMYLEWYLGKLTWCV